MTLRRFPSIEAAVMDLLVEQFPILADDPPGVFHVGRELVADVADRMPYVRVAAIGGPADQLTTRATIDIDVFTLDYWASVNLAGDIQQLLMAYPHRVETGGRVVVLDTVTNPLAPQEVPWTDRNVHRQYASYAISARR